VRDGDPDTEGEKRPHKVEAEESPSLEIAAQDWADASHDPAVRQFVRQAVAGERQLEREGLIFP
jgi:hypothetical protein